MMSEIPLNHDREQRVTLRREFASTIQERIDGGQQPIRVHQDAFNEYVNKATEIGLDHRCVNLGLGDIDTKPMLFEPGFQDLPGLLGTEPNFEIDLEIKKRKAEIEQKYWNKGQSLYRYGGFNGIIEVREAFSRWLEITTGLSISADETFFSAEAGSGAIKRDLSAAVMYSQARNLPANFLSSAPGYSPVFGMVKEQPGMELNLIHCGSKDNYFFQPGQVGDIIKNNEIGVFYIVPINNPTSTKIPPEQLSGVLKETYEANPDILFFVDMAYIASIPIEEAYELMGVFNDYMGNCVFHTSLSKSHASPGRRFGATHTQVDGLDTYLTRASQVGNPSLNESSMTEATALLASVAWETVQRTSQLYAERRNLMIKALGRINEKVGKEIFVNLEELTAPGGLYVYPELAEGMTALDLFIEYGLMGIDGMFFKDDPNANRVRLAIGLKTREEIINLQETLDL